MVCEHGVERRDLQAEDVVQVVEVVQVLGDEVLQLVQAPVAETKTCESVNICSISVRRLFAAVALSSIFCETAEEEELWGCQK